MADIFPKGAAWIGGKVVDISEAHIPILDWGFLRSDATYDVVHVWENRFFLLDRHIERFYSSAKKLKMPCKILKDDLKIILAKCVKKSGLKNAYVEMIQTRGMSPTFDRDPRKATPRFVAFAIPFSWILKPKKINIGLNIAITPITRIPSSSVDPTIKNYHWLDLVQGMFEAYKIGCEAGLLVDEKKNILEGPGFNVFSLNSGVLLSPENGVLKGITRGVVKEIARKHNIKTRFGKLSEKKLLSSEEVFATSTAGGIMPITKINNNDVGDGRAGMITKKIHKTYWNMHSLEKYSCSINSILM